MLCVFIDRHRGQGLQQKEEKMLAPLILEWPPPLARSIPHFCKKAVRQAACKGEQLGASESVLGVNLEPRDSKMTIGIKEENIMQSISLSMQFIKLGHFLPLMGLPLTFTWALLPMVLCIGISFVCSESLKIPIKVKQRDY